LMVVSDEGSLAYSFALRIAVGGFFQMLHIWHLALHEYVTAMKASFGLIGG
jgi:hypothetical protein